MVPVVDKDQNPLMPCTPKRARKMVESGKATPFMKRGIFCIRLNVEPSARNNQQVAVGVDPGSKKEGISVVSTKYTLLNVQLDARTGIKEKMENRKIMRRQRRNRKTPCRAVRSNRACRKRLGRLPPSTKARWDWKLRNLKRLAKLYPIRIVVVEDVAAKTKANSKKWNRSFSAVESGKQWFYREIQKLRLQLETRQGYETKELRVKYNLHKLKAKLSSDFHAHCVDAWVLAADQVGADRPTQKRILCITPLDFRRRSLHYQCPAKGGIRDIHGGTRTFGHRRGVLVKHPKYGFTYLGGHKANLRVSLHSVSSGKRLATHIKIKDCRVIGYNMARWSIHCSSVFSSFSINNPPIFHIGSRKVT